MTPDYKWLADYLEKEIGRLRPIETREKRSLAYAQGDVAKFDHLISMETARDEEYQRAKRIAEKKVANMEEMLSTLSPRLDKMTEQLLIIQGLINE